ncbi:pentapeptide repeat-containing protein [Streptomyces naphthomycinicus]|uniref:pentapeptide repeat-containing protein n=1 Tax=Streptomyces naphthomycinicus TaxID=2872625 RepID=UPI001CEDC529|nr:pentapeptide repeat-containing protein [Streptomyces sp. TML10]
MTILTSLLEYVSLVSTPTPSVSPPLNESTGSVSSPLWAILVVGLGGGLLGGTGVYFGARRSSRSLRESAEKSLEHERIRLLNERFSTAAGLLGHDKAACRLAGVHAMAGLADDWAERRQTCIGVLCAYLRMPYYPLGPDGGTPVGDPADGQANREVRLTVIRTIRDHLLRDTPPETSWCGYDLDFTGATFDGGDFSFAHFSGGKVSFNGATFSGSEVSFRGATFSGSEVGFTGATFSGGKVGFTSATFSGGEVSFRRATFSGSEVSFRGFFSGSEVSFYKATFSAGELSFIGATFSGGEVSFNDAVFSGSEVSFNGAVFSGSEVPFHSAQLCGGVVDMRDPADWSRPPSFDDNLLTTPRAGLLLPDPLPKPKP